MTGLLGLLAVAVGGAAGSLARWGLAQLGARLAQEREIPGTPWPTFAANVLACFLTGILVTWLGSASGGGAQLLYLLTAMGFCGGLSTLSTAALEITDLSRRGAAVISVGYVMLTAGAGLFALWLGLVLAS